MRCPGGADDFDCRAVEGPDDDLWATLGWPDDVGAIASNVEREGAQIIIYYSRAFPDFKKVFDDLERKDTAIAASFDTHYQTWITVHALLHFQDTEGQTDVDEDEAEKFAQSERVRAARVAALMARREMTLSVASTGTGEG